MVLHAPAKGRRIAAMLICALVFNRSNHEAVAATAPSTDTSRPRGGGAKGTITRRMGSNYCASRRCGPRRVLGFCYFSNRSREYSRDVWRRRRIAKCANDGVGSTFSYGEHRQQRCIPLPKSTRSGCIFSAGHNESECDDNTVRDSPQDDDNISTNWTSQTTAIALPALAGMMTDPLLSLVDTLYVGRMGYEKIHGVGSRIGGAASSAAAQAASAGSIPLAALGACTSIFNLSFHCFRATTMSTSSLVAASLVRDEQKRRSDKTDFVDTDDAKRISQNDSRDEREAVLIAQTSVQQAIITGILITTFLLTFGPKCLGAMGIPDDGGALFPSASIYLNHRALAAPAAVMLMASEGVFRGYGDVVTPWKVNCAVAVCNLILDPFCMFGSGGIRGLGMGIKGAAVATALSQVCGALLYGRWLFVRGLFGEGRKAQGSLLRKITGRSKPSRLAKGVAKLKQQKQDIAMSILRANAAMTAKQGSLLLGWAYATSRATRLGHTVVASHQMALSIWMVVALVMEGAGVAAQVLMAREWEGLLLVERREENVVMKKCKDGSGDRSAIDKKRQTIKSLSFYMLRLSLIQGLIGSLSILALRRWSPLFILTGDPFVRQHLLEILPHIAAQMALVSVTLVAEALAIGGGRFKWLAGGTALSSVLAVAKLSGAKSLVSIWSGGIVVLFLGRLATALLAIMDMNNCFSWRENAR